MKVLVTGAARGLGKEIIREFARNGYECIINYNNSEKEAYELKSELEGKVKVEVYKCDISNEDEISDMFSKIDSLDVVVNNAAIAMDKDPLEKSADEFNKVIETNLTGTFLVSKYSVNKMKKGCIINISSTNAIDTNYPESIDYDASKAGVISLTKNFAKYLTDIRVNCICPDWIDTDMNNEMDELYKKSINMLKPEDVAKVVYNLATNENADGLVLKVNNENIDKFIV